MTDDAAISYQAVPVGVPVLTATGHEIGTLEHVLQIPAEDLFDGLVVATADGLRFVDADLTQRMSDYVLANVTMHQRLFTRFKRDEISIREASKNNATIIAARDATAHAPSPGWMDVDRENLKGRIVSTPRRDELTQIPINEQLIVELYSK